MSDLQPEKRTEERTETYGVCLDAISRQGAIKALYTEIIKRRLLDDVNDGMLDEFDTEDILRKLPSAQSEIIRCRDCRYGVDYYHDGNCYCAKPGYELLYFDGSWDFYCANAERRT